LEKISTRISDGLTLGALRLAVVALEAGSSAGLSSVKRR
jgi:hypothetical protein